MVLDVLRNSLLKRKYYRKEDAKIGYKEYKTSRIV